MPVGVYRPDRGKPINAAMIGRSVKRDRLANPNNPLLLVVDVNREEHALAIQAQAVLSAPPCVFSKHPRACLGGRQIVVFVQTLFLRVVEIVSRLTGFFIVISESVGNLWKEIYRCTLYGLATYFGAA